MLSKEEAIDPSLHKTTLIPLLFLSNNLTFQTKPFLQQAANTQVDVGMWFASPAEYEAQFGRS
jgi:hypothetical protein